MLRIGHKGADALAPGNTLASFTAAAEAGVDAIEFDVLRPRGDFDRAEDWRGARGGPGRASAPLLVAHDWADAARREPLTLAEALDALAAPPLDRIRFDLDLKVAGREDEIIAALRERDLLERAMVSTMETSSLAWLRDSESEVERGWTLPKVSRDWAASTWLRPIFYAGAATLRARLPRIIGSGAPKLGVWAVWIYHPLVTERLLGSAHAAGVQVIAWTVDDAERIDELRQLGVDGICTNDPRLLTSGERPPASAELSPSASRPSSSRPR